MNGQSSSRWPGPTKGCRDNYDDDDNNNNNNIQVFPLAKPLGCLVYLTFVVMELDSHDLSGQLAVAN
jgi:hypothetical protein